MKNINIPTIPQLKTQLKYRTMTVNELFAEIKKLSKQEQEQLQALLHTITYKKKENIKNNLLFTEKINQTPTITDVYRKNYRKKHK
jgi:hypothetical protein